MTDRNETKKFLYDTELSTPHKVLQDNYDEQLRAVLNYSPKLIIRKIKGFNECPVPEPPKPKEIPTYSYSFKGSEQVQLESGHTQYAEGTSSLSELGLPFDVRKDYLAEFKDGSKYVRGHSRLSEEGLIFMNAYDGAYLEGRIVHRATNEVVAYVNVTMYFDTTSWRD